MPLVIRNSSLGPIMSTSILPSMRLKNKLRSLQEMDPTKLTGGRNLETTDYLDLLIFGMIILFFMVCLIVAVRLCYKFAHKYPAHRAVYQDDLDELRGKSARVADGVGPTEQNFLEVINRNGISTEGAGGAQRYSVA